MSGRTDPLCVDTAAFIAEITPIREAWEKQHNDSGWGQGSSSFALMLAELTNLNPRRIYGFFTGEFPQVGLDDAARILVALDRPDILSGLTVYRRQRVMNRYELTPIAA